jgi:hypothetical protein
MMMIRGAVKNTQKQTAATASPSKIFYFIFLNAYTSSKSSILNHLRQQKNLAEVHM